MSGERNNVLTASRLSKFLACQRAHYWQYEVGLRKTDTTVALKIGSAWARAMEARWRGADYDDALAAAIPEGIDLDAYSCATVAGLLAAYYRHYGPQDASLEIRPEVQFSHALKRSRTFTVAGKIDGLGARDHRNYVLVEAKTTSDSVEPDSDYWLRLRFNMQVLQYVGAGWDVSEVIYDVVRKPSIKPKQVYDLDDNGLKIVLDPMGQRVFKDNGEPRQTGDEKKMWVVKTHLETPDEFANRLTIDVASRPEFYFARREVPILDRDLRAFEAQRLTIARMIMHLRASEKRVDRRQDAWPRNVSERSCKFCPYQSFCLQDLTVDVSQPPAGFSVQPFNPELDEQDDTIETADATA